MRKALVVTTPRAITPREQSLIDAAVSAALATRKVRTSVSPKAPTAPLSEPDRVASVLRMQNGFRGRILRYIVGEIGDKPAKVFTYADMHNVPALSDISPSNVAACLLHISWKLQGGEADARAVGDAGYTLAVSGRKDNVQALLVRSLPVVKAPRKGRKAKIAPVEPVVSDETSSDVA
jgi:hypothetical protein